MDSIARTHRIAVSAPKPHRKNVTEIKSGLCETLEIPRLSTRNTNTSSSASFQLHNLRHQRRIGSSHRFQLQDPHIEPQDHLILISSCTTLKLEQHQLLPRSPRAQPSNGNVSSSPVSSCTALKQNISSRLGRQLHHAQTGTSDPHGSPDAGPQTGTSAPHQISSCTPSKLEHQLPRWVSSCTACKLEHEPPRVSSCMALKLEHQLPTKSPAARPSNWNISSTPGSRCTALKLQLQLPARYQLHGLKLQHQFPPRVSSFTAL
uniref:Uncharacterized protein n=1 Tax=Pongo abelii TaxID=9601 RepID=A0A8I5SZW6_PONAB